MNITRKTQEVLMNRYGGDGGLDVESLSHSHSISINLSLSLFLQKELNSSRLSGEIGIGKSILIIKIIRTKQIDTVGRYGDNTDVIIILGFRLRLSFIWFTRNGHTR